ncbi:hypothetical protein BZA05DRAFT_380105 [Tricharina praecox]|uniref:uncharacterized protein n=1 Tax=Tricharina praecox TaxID=43433 RepID=UPI00221F39C0|nr:uncharacterized protein BZA05DRAFT_380105 [Tricharina praecox]KAI5842057.1 hypothetical protein BZA05DRAFT_380105 [Tricharina praecox]
MPDAPLNWRLSAHPITLCFFLAFRLASLLTYLFGLWFSSNFVLIFIIVTLLLSADFYYVKNIAGRRLVGLRWWNEPSASPASTANSADSGSTWIFESAPPERVANATDTRFFWLSLYASPVLWVLLAVVAILRFEFIWLSLVVVAVVLGVTNGVAFSRADRFGNASSFAGRAMQTGVGGWAGRLAGRMMWGGR